MIDRFHRARAARATRRGRRAALGALMVVALIGAATPADAARPHPNPPGIDRCDWASFRNSAANSGASLCRRISARNVATLHPQLLYRTRDSVTATPAVVDGMLYVGSWDGTFYAFDTRRGGIGDPSFAGLPVAPVAPKWTFQIDDENGVSFGRIVSSAAVTDIGGTRVVIFAGGATLYALDAANGAPLAKLCLDPRSDAAAAPTGGRCAGSPNSQVEVESSPALVRHDDGSVGIVIGQDNHNRAGIGRTGVVRMRLELGAGGWTLRPEWKFDPEARAVYNAAQQGADFLSYGSGTGQGCGGVWGTPALDVTHDVVVFGTSSCSYPGADVAGEKVYGVRLSTGEELWRFSPPRPWGSRTDDDFGSSPQLFTTSHGLIAGAGSKDGWYYALDALTGAPVWSTQAGQPGHANEDFAIGGVIGSPAVGMARGRKAVFVTTAISTPIGAPIDYGTLDSLDTSLAEDPARLLSIHALDAETGALLWRSPLTRQSYGHPTYTNGLVFVPSTAGFAVDAYDANTGLPRWRSTPLDGAPSSGVAVTERGIYFGAGTRQTDAGFKIQGEDSTVPEPLQVIVRATPVADYLGADPQERLAGIWAFHLAR